ncbi:MAG: hypothetical protein IJH08_09455, partial [Atopobiaceae bacterium]|nr:hypothetical protein [Atopobiaceae bacterium]
MAVEEVEVYEYEGGVCVDPKSDTKVVFIPSPPTKMEQKINPRPAIILFARSYRAVPFCVSVPSGVRHTDSQYEPHGYPSRSICA